MERLKLERGNTKRKGLGKEGAVKKAKAHLDTGPDAYRYYFHPRDINKGSLTPQAPAVGVVENKELQIQKAIQENIQKQLNFTI